MTGSCDRRAPAQPFGLTRGDLHNARNNRTWAAGSKLPALLIALGAVCASLLWFNSAAGAQNTARVKIVLDVGGDTSVPFEFGDGQTSANFSLRHGQSRTFTVPSGSEIRFNQTEGGSPPGYVFDGVDCTGDSGRLSTLGKTIRGTLLGGANVECVFVNRRTSTATVTLRMNAGGDTSQDFTVFDDQAREQFTLRGGASRSFQVTSNESFLFFQTSAPSGWEIGTPSCSGDNGAIEERDTGAIQGSLPANANVTCTFFVTKPQSATITIINEASEDTDRIFRGRFIPAPGSVSNVQLRSGQQISFTQILSNSVDIVMFDGDGWRPHRKYCEGDGGALRFTTTDTGTTLTGDLGSAARDITCVFSQSPVIAAPNNVFPLVTCLAGNGRVDVNVVNTSSVDADYRVEIGNLTPRVTTVKADDWWRSPATGREDGLIGIRLLRDETVIMNDKFDVSCDSGDEEINAPEVQLLNTCRNGRGFVAWQFANPTGQNRAYAVSFEGVPNRSTTASPYGATVRGVSGRPDGTYSYTLTANGVVILRSSVTVDCQ